MANVMTVAGPTFETKNRELFSEELFSGEEFLEQHYCPRTLFPSMFECLGVDSFSPN